MFKLGAIIAKELLNQFDNGLNINKFQIVGHSLGGQIAGIIGREVYARSKKTKLIKRYYLYIFNFYLNVKFNYFNIRISALDPAFPLFYTGGLTNHLKKSDAEFVDVIHTDAWIYGAPVSTGTADFWPNGGTTLQPGCPKRNYKMLTDNGNR